MSASSSSLSEKWKDERRVAGTRKWHPFWEAATREATATLLEALPLRPGLRVLDLASGSGDPALAVARAVLPEGRVTATDLGRDILEIAEENARLLGLSNLHFEVADAQALPFPDASYDAVTCRFGVMFFPDCLRALRECVRVLRPGGRAVFLAWGSWEQPYFASTIGVLRKYAAIPGNLFGGDVSHPFRFAQPGKLHKALEEAGFSRVQEEARTIRLTWPGPPAQVWEFFTETTMTYRPFLEGLAAGQRAEFAAEVQAACESYSDGATLKMPGAVVLATGTRT